MTNPATPAPKGGMPKWLIILLVVLGIVLLTCCGMFTMCTYILRQAPAIVQNQMGMNVDTTGAGISLPANFPADIPVFRGVKATSSISPTCSRSG